MRHSTIPHFVPCLMPNMASSSAPTACILLIALILLALTPYASCSSRHLRFNKSARPPSNAAFVASGSLQADDWSYAVQVPPQSEASGGSWCRRIDAGGAVVLRRRGRPLPVEGATLKLHMKLQHNSSSPDASDSSPLHDMRISAAASDKSSGGNGSSSGVAFEQLPGAAGQGLEGGAAGELSFSVRTIASGDEFDQITIERSDESGPGIMVLCIQSLVVDY